jgi:hypothetical protein
MIKIAMFREKENVYFSIILSQNCKIHNYLLQALVVFTNTQVTIKEKYRSRRDNKNKSITFKITPLY